MSRALGRYELLRPLARGGMAEVYLARRRAGGVEKWLVVKRIRAERSNDVKFLDLFVREARLSMSLAHQNIVPVFDFGRIDDQVFLAMERVEGRDLGSSLGRAAEKTPPILMPPLVAAFIASECCQALEYAHRRKSPEGTPLGIVHRDVTPRNVLLSWSGEVKLTDFGIASLAGDETTSLVGTPAYMAPEQARKAPVDLRADLYSVGLLLREMLVGERARTGGDRDALVAEARTAELPPWPANPTVDMRLVAIVDRATSAKPEDRYEDARAMLAALDDFIVAERAANKSESPARRLTAWLDAVWGAEREDAGPGGDIEAEHMLSFMDDGLDLLGTGTQRSMMATAAEDDAPATPAPPIVAERESSSVIVTPDGPRAKRETAKVADKLPLATPASGSGATSSSADGDSAVSAPTGKPPLIYGLLAMVALAVIVWFVIRGPSQPVNGGRMDASIIATVDDAVAGDGPEPDADIDAALDATVEIDAVAESIDAAVPVRADAGITRPRVDGAIAMPRPDAAAHDAAVVTAAPKTHVTIQAIPWAYFTVDNDPTQHQTIKTIDLTPGPHVIHFSNPILGINRDRSIDVPTDHDPKIVERL
ncbi:MAG TPA: serine/threonine-protein kinase [Kofleriaceae bacterium]|jgi:serine/threonine protein kinase